MQSESSLLRLRRFAASCGLAALLALGGLNAHAAEQAAEPAASLDNATCLGCHDAKKPKLEVKDANGKPHPLQGIPSDKYGQSVHSMMQCVTCHTEIKDNAEKGNVHAKNTAQPLTKPDCANCHMELWDLTQKRGRTEDRPRLGVVAKNIEAYRKSFHARPSSDDKTKPNAECNNCHEVHSFNVPAAKNSSENTQWRLSIPNLCGNCHAEQLEAYRDSVHGQENAKKMLAQAAVCSDCHTAHAISNTSGDPFKLTVTSNCGGCHDEQFKSYKDTFHGRITTLGYAYTAKCFDCHGSHEIKRVDNKASMVSDENRLETCAKCHNPKKGLAPVSKGFASFQPHGSEHNFARYPQMWVAFQMMTGLLVGTFAFFWLHTALWFYREYKERKARAGQPHVRLDEVPPALQHKHVQRFSRIWRAAHLIFAVSLMILTLTGMPLFYPDVPWAPAIMKLLGGPRTAGLIHRAAAVIFAGVFFWHLVYILYRIGRNIRTFKVFGPDSLVPGLQDGKDMLAMFQWFFGMGPRPKFDRWTYWEKFDYWAPFWGVTIIGMSGLIMWLPGFFGSFLPGWIFNVAAIFHGEEAFLAVVFLFTVHFFNNHFRPDKFPVEVVMFTGTMSLEEFKTDHGVEYQRLLESGELQSRLVEPPSTFKVKASKALAFTLIAVGLTLLTLVGVGFFRGG